MDRFGWIYVCDSKNCKVQVFDPDLNFSWEFTGRGFPGVPYPFLEGVSTTFDGKIVVADMHGGIMVFSKKGTPIKYLNKIGPNEDVPISDIHGISIGPDGSLVITETQNHRISIFDSNFKFIKTIFVQFPYAVSHNNKNGNFYVTSCPTTRGSKTGLYIFSSVGNLLKKIDGKKAETFEHPVGVDVDDDGNLLLADFSGKKIHIVDKYENFVNSIPNIEGPTFAAVHRDGSVLIVLSKMILVYEPSNKYTF